MIDGYFEKQLLIPWTLKPWPVSIDPDLEVVIHKLVAEVQVKKNGRNACYFHALVQVDQYSLVKKRGNITSLAKMCRIRLKF